MASLEIPQIRRWPQMHEALKEVFGGDDFEVHTHLFSGFREIQGQQGYAAWLLGWRAMVSFENYLGLLEPSRRVAVAAELKSKFADFVRACADGELDEAALQDAQTTFDMLCVGRSPWETMS